VSEPDTRSQKCADKNILKKEQYSAPHLAARRKSNDQCDVTNVRNFEPGMMHIGSSAKSLGGLDSYEQDVTNVPTVEQLEHLTPSKELLIHYRKKILQLNNDYQDLMEKVDK
jgi:hypothetical protein